MDILSEQEALSMMHTFLSEPVVFDKSIELDKEYERMAHVLCEKFLVGINAIVDADGRFCHIGARNLISYVLPRLNKIMEPIDMDELKKYMQELEDKLNKEGGDFAVEFNECAR